MFAVGERRTLPASAQTSGRVSTRRILGGNPAPGTAHATSLGLNRAAGASRQTMAVWHDVIASELTLSATPGRP